MEKSASTEAKDINGNTALIWASTGGYIEVVKLLLQGGANIEAKDNKENTALMWAAKTGHTDIVHLLREKSGPPA